MYSVDLKNVTKKWGDVTAVEKEMYQWYFKIIVYSPT